MEKKKLKIVQILPELEEGGVEGETLDLAGYLAREGHQSIVISGGGRLVAPLLHDGSRHIHWSCIGEKSFRCLQYLFKLRQFLLREQVDILHLRSRLPAWIGYLVWKSLPIEQRPSLITTFHGFYSINSYSRIMAKGELVAAVSQTIQEHIVDNYHVPKERIRLIHGGFDVDAFNPAAVSKERVDALRQKWLKGKSDRQVILLPGRLTQWKGQDVFIESLSHLKDIDFVALLIGDTEENVAFTKKLRERIAYHELQEKVFLVGHCSDMPAALLLGDVVVSASSTQPEAFGKIAIEAMAMGKPVVATAHGGSLETVVPGKTGWLVAPLDTVEMARAIREALENPEEASSKGETGRVWVNKRFTAEAMCRKTLDLYYEVHKKCLERRKKKKITVLQLLPELNSGGVERGTLEMGGFLAKTGHRSLVVSNGGRLVPQLEAEGSEHFLKSIGSKSPRSLMHLLPLRSLILKENVDILHLRSRMPAWIGYIAWRLIRPSRRPVLVTTFHGFYSVNAYSAIMTRGDGVIAVSRSIKQHIREKYNRSKNVELIFRGVDVDSFCPENVSSERVAKLAQEWEIERSKPILMLPGRLTKLKGQEIFLKSLLLVKNNDFLAVLVGDTEDNPGYTATLREFIVSNGLDNRVKLVGHCTDMPAAFMLADIVLSTSSLEPEAFGRTSVEAMAMGKPVIATAHGGSIETVLPGENGWLVKPSDVMGLARAIEQALNTDQLELHRLGNEGRKRVNECFTARAMCEKTLNFYRYLLDKKRAA